MVDVKDFLIDEKSSMISVEQLIGSFKKILCRS